MSGRRASRPKTRRPLLPVALLSCSASAFLRPPLDVKALRVGRVTARLVDEMVGADVETGGVWDPLGFANDELSLFRRQAVELKHGRICMLATVGVVVQTFYHLPDPVFANPRPIGALLQVWEQRPLALVQILLFLGWIDLTVGKQDYDHREPGQLGFGEAFRPRGRNANRQLELAELKHGRLAMISIMGMLIQEGVTKQGPIEQLMVGNIWPAKLNAWHW